jgi:hypothetical protein
MSMGCRSAGTRGGREDDFGSTHALQYCRGILSLRIDIGDGTQFLGQRPFLAATRDRHRAETHMPGELSTKMAEATYALHCHEIA